MCPAASRWLLSGALAADPSVLSGLTVEQLLKFDRMGKTLAEKLVAQISATRRMPLDTFLQALKGAYDRSKELAG